jgi:CDP-paratose 2-epimerase
MEKTVLFTGSLGLVGSEVVTTLLCRWLESLLRRQQSASRFLRDRWRGRLNQERLVSALPRFQHREVDIRHRPAVTRIPPPSRRPTALLRFPSRIDNNAVGTPNPLEAARRAMLDSPFVHVCSNTVYGCA